VFAFESASVALASSLRGNGARQVAKSRYTSIRADAKRIINLGASRSRKENGCEGA
jgi:hypothetical protein